MSRYATLGVTNVQLGDTPRVAVATRLNARRFVLMRRLSNDYNQRIDDQPIHLDLKKDDGLTVQWSDGSTSFFSIVYLRKMSPSADAKELRKEMARNPLTVLPSSVANQMTGAAEPLTALDAEFVGNYAIRIRFSDGHDTGLYSWKYLREIDREDSARAKPQAATGGATRQVGSGANGGLDT